MSYWALNELNKGHVSFLKEMGNRKFFILGKSEKIVEIEKLVDKRHLAIFSLNSQFYLENISKLQTFI